MQEYTLTDQEKETLLGIARQTLECHLQGKPVPAFSVESPNLQEERGAFVTLHKQGQLRGCIGRIVGDTAVFQVVSDFAIEAAQHDPRFDPVVYDELPDIEIEISILTPFTEVADVNEIEVGRDGLMIRKGWHSGLLLPQVPVEWHWDRQTFLQQTCQKAGLPLDAYTDPDAQLYKFSAIVFSESEHTR